MALARRAWMKHGAKARNIGVSAIFLALALLGACGDEGPSTRLETPGDAPDQILWDFTTTDSDSGELRWILKAHEARIFQAQKRVEALGIQVDIYDGLEALSSVLTADSGLIDRRTGNMTALGHVHVDGKEDYELRTSILHWDQERKVYHTKAFVEVRQGENRYSGFDMECDQRLEHLRIQREPSGIIADEGAAVDG